jgi:hypothetical protein
VHATIDKQLLQVLREMLFQRKGTEINFSFPKIMVHVNFRASQRQVSGNLALHGIQDHFRPARKNICCRPAGTEIWWNIEETTSESLKNHPQAGFQTIIQMLNRPQAVLRLKIPQNA